MIDANKFELSDLMKVQSGYPFRGSIIESSNGDTLAVQMKNLDPETGVDWSGVTRTSLTGRKQPDWLQRGDILFVAKGDSFYAALVDEPPSPAVCSPHIFHLQVKMPDSVMSSFLVWQMNQPPFQRQLEMVAEGTSQLSIRRPVLEALRLSIPSIADQRRIVALVDLAHQEHKALNQLICNRKQQLNALADNLFQAAL